VVTDTKEENYDSWLLLQRNVSDTKVWVISAFLLLLNII